MKDESASKECETRIECMDRVGSEECHMSSGECLGHGDEHVVSGADNANDRFAGLLRAEGHNVMDTGPFLVELVFPSLGLVLIPFEPGFVEEMGEEELFESRDKDRKRRGNDMAVA